MTINKGARVYGLQDEGSSRFNFSRIRRRGDSCAYYRTNSYICDIREAIVVF